MNVLDVQGILERAGADPDAPEGSQAWALAQVGIAVAELVEALKRSRKALREARGGIFDDATLADQATTAALARVDGAT